MKVTPPSVAVVGDKWILTPSIGKALYTTDGHIRVATLNKDLTQVVSKSPAFKLEKGEGSHAYKINGTYYVFAAVFDKFPILSVRAPKVRRGRLIRSSC